MQRTMPCTSCVVWDAQSVLCCATYATHLGVAPRRLGRVVPHQAEAEVRVRDLLAEALWLVLWAHL
eukprot:scaffold1007_cov61-Phaeocystis_antarctica.AAC.11